LTAVLAGQVDATIETMTILVPHIRAGKLRALAVTTRERSPLMPELPTMTEAGVPDYEVTAFNGLVAPAGTPPEIVAKLNKAVNEGMQAPEIQERLNKLGAIAPKSSPAEFGAFIAAENAKWSAVAKSANIKVD
jgi:tripartite-type tricarboxylate transporter receptor subunit TctC